mgnify:CR=1 FL=1
MITVDDLSLQYSGAPLFSKVNLQFTPGNCYGIIGANGAGKSTFLKILSGDLEPSTGEVSILPNTRMSVLKQNQNAYDAYNVMDTVIMGNQRLYDIGKEKEALYAKEEMTDEDGMRACQLEEEYAELGGWEAESDASRILQGLGIGTDLHYNDMATLDARLKVKVLLAQALFGNPDLLMMDEPTNNLDIDTIRWLEQVLNERDSTMIIISHDRHFLNMVCTHMADLDYGELRVYAGNYDEYMTAATQARERLLADKQLRSGLKAERYVSGETGLPTVTDILEALDKRGLDPREQLQVFAFDPNVHTIGDLREGMLLPGIVTNITAFGAFVDIGVKQDGLVHISQLADRYVASPADVVHLGQHVEVRVTGVDTVRGRIALSMRREA